MTTRRERLGRPLRHYNVLSEAVRRVYPKAIVTPRGAGFAIFTCPGKTLIVGTGRTPRLAWMAAAKFVDLPRGK